MGYKLITIVNEESTNIATYSIQRDSDKMIRDIDLDALKKYIGDVENVKLDENGNLKYGEEVKQITVWNYYNTGGKVIQGLNDLETYCLKNDLEGKLENYNLGNNSLKANEISKSSNKVVKIKCRRCGYEHETKLNYYIDRYSNDCIRCAAQDGIGVTHCISGVNDLYTICIKENKQYMIDEYDDERDIHKISAKSDEKVQWKCKYGHIWMATPGTRMNKNTGCPKCKGSQTSKTERMICNWLKENNINIIERDKIQGEEFDINLVDYNVLIELNSDHTHSTIEVRNKDAHKLEIAKGLNKHLIVLMQLCYPKEDETLHWDISFRADKRNYIQQLIKELSTKLRDYNIEISDTISTTAIADANMNNVPYERSLVGVYTNIEKYWSPNNEVEPSRIFASSRKYVKLICQTCMEEYEIRADAIKQSWNKQTKGCPYCSGKKVITGETDLATLEPEICLDWHPVNKLNGLEPTKISVHSNKKAMWKCHVCGNEWEAMINSRTGVNRTGCPVCNQHNQYC